ncbi:MAG: mechanosensitive ion channel [Tidjanibacter sp.]|nr:mechanosensitive ion channel [Tidjanibacter sp.]
MMKEKTFLLDWMSTLLDWLGLNSADGGYKALFATLVVLVCCFVVWWLLRYLLLRAHRLGRYVDSRLEVIFDRANLNKIALMAAVFMFYILLPLAFDPASSVGIFVRKALDVLIVWMLASFANSVVRTVFMLIYHKRKTKDAPLKGFMQVIQIVVWVVAAIVIIAILINKSPTKLFTGLGASLAVLSFVFKDSILNLVSGILLSSDKMVKVGDWIEMPSAGIDGTVIDMTLNTVKVRGWDNTISNVSPYTLTSGTFKNWQGMFSSGGRRIARYVEIDINTVKFCTEELLERVGKLEVMREYIDSLPEPRLQTTNLELLRVYIERYMEAQPWLNREMLHMVRQLQSSDTGVPLQVYAFTATTVWVEYERIQAALFEHIMAIVPLFEIKIFQRPSGGDLDKRATIEDIVKWEA